MANDALRKKPTCLWAQTRDSIFLTIVSHGLKTSNVEYKIQDNTIDVKHDTFDVNLTLLHGT
jgi:hypothetical protein